MSKRDHKTDKATSSRGKPARDFRRLLETDRMRLPENTFDAIEQLLREMHWLLRMAKAESEAE